MDHDQHAELVGAITAVATAIDRASQRAQVGALKSLADRAAAERYADALDELIAQDEAAPLTATTRRAMRDASKLLRSL